MPQDPKKTPQTTNGGASAAGVEVHVMPKEFLGKEASMKEALKPAVAAAKPAPVATKAPPAPPVAPPAKKKSRLPVILLIIGIIMLAVIAGGSYVILQGLQEEVTPIPEPEPEPVPEPEPEPEPIEITQGRDTDSDGLTDREEGLYGTDPRNPDTDGDTFLDGNEVFHRYDPLGYAPSTLLDTGSVVEYTSVDAEFSVTYPRTWTLTTNVGGGIVVRAPTTANFELAITDAATYVPSGEEGLTKNGYVSYTPSDQMQTTVLVGDKAYVFTYELDQSTTIDYLQSFQMFVNSFIVQP